MDNFENFVASRTGSHYLALGRDPEQFEAYWVGHKEALMDCAQKARRAGGSISPPAVSNAVTDYVDEHEEIPEPTPEPELFSGE